MIFFKNKMISFSGYLVHFGTSCGSIMVQRRYRIFLEHLWRWGYHNLENSKVKLSQILNLLNFFVAFAVSFLLPCYLLFRKSLIKQIGPQKIIFEPLLVKIYQNYYILDSDACFSIYLSFSSN